MQISDPFRISSAETEAGPDAPGYLVADATGRILAYESSYATLVTAFVLGQGGPELADGGSKPFRVANVVAGDGTVQAQTEPAPPLAYVSDGSHFIGLTSVGSVPSDGGAPPLATGVRWARYASSGSLVDTTMISLDARGVGQQSVACGQGQCLIAAHRASAGVVAAFVASGDGAPTYAALDLPQLDGSPVVARSGGQYLVAGYQTKPAPGWYGVRVDAASGKALDDAPRVLYSGEAGGYGALASNGRGYLLLLAREGGATAVSLDLDAAPAKAPLASLPAFDEMTVASNGDSYLALVSTYHDGVQRRQSIAISSNGVASSPIDHGLAAQQVDFGLALYPSRRSLVWTGTSYAAAWWDAETQRTRIATLAADGHELNVQTPFPPRLVPATEGAPSVAYGGGAYFVVTPRKRFFLPQDRLGPVTSSALAAPEGEEYWAAQLVASSSGFLAYGGEGTGFSAQRFSREGEPLDAAPVSVVADAGLASAAARGGDWVFVYEDQDDPIESLRIAADGTVTQMGAVAPGNAPQSRPRIASNDDGYFAVWLDYRGTLAIWGAALDPEGRASGSGERIGYVTADATQAEIAAGKGRFLIAWIDADGVLRTQLVSQSGAKLGGASRIGPARGVSGVVFDGRGFWVRFGTVAEDGGPGAEMFQYVDVAGAPAGAPRTLAPLTISSMASDGEGHTLLTYVEAQRAWGRLVTSDVVDAGAFVPEEPLPDAGAGPSDRDAGAVPPGRDAALHDASAADAARNGGASSSTDRAEGGSGCDCRVARRRAPRPDARAALVLAIALLSARKRCGKSPHRPRFS